MTQSGRQQRNGRPTVGGKALGVLEEAAQRGWRVLKPPVDISYPRGDRVYPANIRPGAVYEQGLKRGQPKPVCLYTFQEAMSALERGVCDGVGIATGDFGGLPLCGIDLDGVFDEKGRPLPEWAETIATVAQNGYSEISPSGRGLRGLALCRKPEGYREKADVNGHDVEVRFDGHYMTLTGDRRSATVPLSEDATAVQWICEGYLRDKPTGGVSKVSNSPPDFLSVGLERDAAFSACWHGVFDGGDERPMIYPS